MENKRFSEKPDTPKRKRPGKDDRKIASLEKRIEKLEAALKSREK